MSTSQTSIQANSVPISHKRVDNIPMYNACLLQPRQAMLVVVGGTPHDPSRPAHQGLHLVLAYQAVYFVIIGCFEEGGNSSQLDHGTRNEGFQTTIQQLRWRCFEM